MIGLSVSLDVDPIGVLIHAGIFLLVMTVISRFLLRPLTRIHQARTDATQTRESHAAAHVAQAEQMEAEYRVKVSEARLAAMAVREDLRQQGHGEAMRIMQAARKAAVQQIETVKAELNKEVEAARQLLSANAQDFAQLIVSRLLEREIENENAAAETSTPPTAVGKGQ